MLSRSCLECPVHCRSRQYGCPRGRAVPRSSREHRALRASGRSPAGCRYALRSLTSPRKAGASRAPFGRDPRLRAPGVVPQSRMISPNNASGRRGCRSSTDLGRSPSAISRSRRQGQNSCAFSSIVHACAGARPASQIAVAYSSSGRENARVSGVLRSCTTCA